MVRLTPRPQPANLDKVIKSRLPTVTKSRDRQLAKQQALTLDAVGPVTYILEEAVKGQLNKKQWMMQHRLLYDSSAMPRLHASREWRKNALQSMNTRLLDMAEDDAMYKLAAPFLFGEGFCKKAKERDEKLKCLNMATAKPTQAALPFFSRGPFL